MSLETQACQSPLERLKRAGIVVLLASLAISALSIGAVSSDPGSLGIVNAQKNLPPGLEPYSPTKIEWLHLECVATLGASGSLEKDGFTIAPQQEGNDTILIYVSYRPTVDRKKMNETIDVYRMIIGTIVKRHGWESWVRIKEELVPLER
jgi:hypothetical protein